MPSWLEAGLSAILYSVQCTALTFVTFTTAQFLSTLVLEREREREHCLLQLDELDSNYDKNTQLYIIMYDKVNIKINIHIISH